MRLLNCFPEGYTPREQQIHVLNKIDDCIRRGVKYIILNAPTGFGKSFIPKTLATYSKDPDKEFVDLVESYEIFKKDKNVGGYKYDGYTWDYFGSTVLTVTKNLQNQYCSEFDNMAYMKGKLNYACQFDKDFRVDGAPCITSESLLKECWDCNRCTYYNHRNESLTNKFSSLNYSVFLSLPEHVKTRQFMVLDEASELEDILVDNFSLEINYKHLLKFEVNHDRVKDDNDLQECKFFINDLFDELRSEVDWVRREMKKKPKNMAKLAMKNSYLTNLMSDVEKVLKYWRDVPYIPEKIDNGITFTPLKVDTISKELFDYGETVILMSATIIDYKAYCKDLGLKEGEYEYIESPSCFDPKKSPIKIINKYPLNYKNLTTNLPKVVDIADMICEKHKDEKGLIHTNSFKITNEYKKKLKSDRFLYREGDTKNEDLLKTHSETDEPTVLISPSMTHGVDLKGDLGRFQIISKVPYLPINNKRIKMKMKDYSWYNRKMLSTLVQACGRTTRTNDDSSVTYIIDGSVEKAITMNKSKLPIYFKDRLV